jgi:nucleoside-diphosphate-sugar epimerase
MSGTHHVLVTGASGFVGSALCRALLECGHAVRPAVRSGASPALPGGVEPVVVGDLGTVADWTAALHGIDCVIHLAARTHVLRETAADPLAEYRRINLHATEQLARSAVAGGVRRFVFMSSIKVNGERTSSEPYTERDPPRPEDAYGVSKREAEQALWQVTAGTATEAVVLRPPLVYGAGVKGNFLRLLEIASRGWPLPLASVRNRRSMIYLGNLVDAVLACVMAPAAAGKTYLVSDGDDISTPELIRATAQALGVRARLFPCPVALLALAAGLAGKRSELEKLTGSLQVDGSLIRSELGWRPRYTLAQGLAETARWYHAAAHARPQNKSA